MIAVVAQLDPLADGSRQLGDAVGVGLAGELAGGELAGEVLGQAEELPRLLPTVPLELVPLGAALVAPGGGVRPLRPEFDWLPVETLGAKPGSSVIEPALLALPVIEPVLLVCDGLLSPEPVTGVGDGVPIARVPPLPQATMDAISTMAAATMIKRRPCRSSASRIHLRMKPIDRTTPIKPI
jgi:hypothetical protein